MYPLQSQSPLPTVLFLAAMALLFWLMIVRPARRQQARTKDLQRDLNIGDEVLLSSGIFGTVEHIGDDRIRLEIADGVAIEVAKQAVVRKVSADQPEQAATEAPETPDSTESTDGEDR